ncbi:hypothetical protein ACLOJK_033788, partial [Asimina triloba]
MYFGENFKNSIKTSTQINPYDRTDLDPEQIATVVAVSYSIPVVVVVFSSAIAVVVSSSTVVVVIQVACKAVVERSELVSVPAMPRTFMPEIACH